MVLVLRCQLYRTSSQIVTLLVGFFVGQGIQQFSGLDEVRRFCAFGEPLIDGREQVARGIGLAAADKKRGKGEGTTKFPGPRLLLTRAVDGCA